MRKWLGGLLKRLPSQEIAHRALLVGQTFLSVLYQYVEQDRQERLSYHYAVNEVPQPQLPVAFGFVNVKPEPMTPVT
jgi:hypothetical protein